VTTAHVEFLPTDKELLDVGGQMGKKYFVGDEVMRSFDCVIVGREFVLRKVGS
jgi:hypothetical protein